MRLMYNYFFIQWLIYARNYETPGALNHEASCNDTMRHHEVWYCKTPCREVWLRSTAERYHVYGFSYVMASVMLFTVFSYVRSLYRLSCYATQVALATPSYLFSSLPCSLVPKRVLERDSTQS